MIPDHTLIIPDHTPSVFVPVRVPACPVSVFDRVPLPPSLFLPAGGFIAGCGCPSRFPVWHSTTCLGCSMQPVKHCRNEVVTTLRWGLTTSMRCVLLRAHWNFSCFMAWTLFWQFSNGLLLRYPNSIQPKSAFQASRLPWTGRFPFSHMLQAGPTGTGRGSYCFRSA